MAGRGREHREVRPLHHITVDSGEHGWWISMYMVDSAVAIHGPQGSLLPHAQAGYDQLPESWRETFATPEDAFDFVARRLDAGAVEEPKFVP